MREYTTIITIKVIASVMEESERDAMVRSCGIEYSDDPDDPPGYYGSLPTLIRPQVIDGTAFMPISVEYARFKARSFKEAYREVHPDIEPGCEAQQIVYPPNYPGLPKGE